MDDFLGMGMGFEMCEDCSVNPATIHLTHVENNEAETFHLCEDCARARGIPFPDSDTLLRGLEALLANSQGGGLGDILGGALGGGLGDALGNALVKVTVKQAGAGANKKKPPRVREEQPQEDIACPNCGMKLSELRAGSSVGCAECYAAFGEHIDRILFQVHGAGGHRGKRYGGAGAITKRGGGKKELERLRKDLELAIKNEDFEQAAVIRDAIRAVSAAVEADADSENDNDNVSAAADNDAGKTSAKKTRRAKAK